MQHDNFAILSEFLRSEFYRQYAASYPYYTDKIIRKLSGSLPDGRKKARSLTVSGYEAVYHLNIKVMTDILSFFEHVSIPVEPDLIRDIVHDIYIDIDDRSVILFDDEIRCSGDALLSLNRMIDHLGICDAVITEYAEYRRECCLFHFPVEHDGYGINSCRYSQFGDRPDHTLYDIRNYYLDPSKCHMKEAFQGPYTTRWLQKLGSFDAVVQWLGVDGIFVNAAGEVYDLEKGDGSVITEYCETYSRCWSERYYANLKVKIQEMAGLLHCR